MRRRRKNKHPLWITVPAWMVVGAVVGWGGWQAILLRQSIVKSAAARETLASAVEGETVEPVGAMGGEPWAESTSSDPEIADPRIITAEDTNPDLLEVYPTFELTLSPGDLFAQGRRLLDCGQVVPARFALNAALARSTDESESQNLRELLASINGGFFLGSDVLPDDPAARFIELQPGDNYLKLGRLFGVPAACIEQMNPALNARLLKPGAGVKIVQGPFHMRLYKSAKRLDLYAREMYVRSYSVQFPGGNYLPRGQYQVTAGTKLQLGGKTWIGFEGWGNSGDGEGIGGENRPRSRMAGFSARRRPGGIIPGITRPG